MKKHYYSVLEQLSLPPEGEAALRDAYARTEAAYPDLLEKAVTVYYDTDFAAEPLYEMLYPVAEELGITESAMNFALIACSSKRLLSTYRERGYDEAMFTDFLRDVACKIGENYRWHGVWGLPKITYWYPLFLGLRLFALGRLQYEIYQRPNEDRPITVGGHTVQPEDKVYFIHIPGLGPLTKELRMDSYRRAYTFFKDDFKDKPCVFYCTSWMLYERNREFMSPTSNIIAFMNDFKIVKSFEVPVQKYWWVFDRPYEGDASVLPRDTSLRRRMAEWLESGGVPGGGDGYFLFDGETIINN